MRAKSQPLLQVASSHAPDNLINSPCQPSTSEKRIVIYTNTSPPFCRFSSVSRRRWYCVCPSALVSISFESCPPATHFLCGTAREDQGTQNQDRGHREGERGVVSAERAAEGALRMTALAMCLAWRARVHAHATTTRPRIVQAPQRRISADTKAREGRSGRGVQDGPTLRVQCRCWGFWCPTRD